MFKYIRLLLCLVWGNCALAQSISLAGKWQFAMDPNDAGEQQAWYSKDLPDNITLPGSMLTNNKGNEVTISTKWTGSIYDSSWYFNPRLAKYRQPGNVMFPFWLTPNKYYVGAAWYRRQVNIPADWAGQRVVLLLERSHFETTVWVDDQPAGTHTSFVTAHEYDLTKHIKPGTHTITVRVDNRIKKINVGPDSHSLTDHTQGNWNGIVGKMELLAGGSGYVRDVQVWPDVARKTALVKLWLNGSIEQDYNITAGATAFNTTKMHVVKPVTKQVHIKDSAYVEIELPMSAAVQLWDEHSPVLYKLFVKMQAGKGTVSNRTVDFGMRDFKTKGTQFEVNGVPAFLRGTVNNCEFPLTGYAPMDVASWEALFSKAKRCGLNHMRFHSWCPPEAAFEAADKVGFYLQPEGPSWPNHGTSIGDGKPVDKFLYEECDRIVQAYGNHPSFCMLALGNEPAGRNQAKFLGEFCRYWQAKDSRRVYTGASVAMSWPLVPENDYMIKSGARGLSWANGPESQSDYLSAIEKFPMPYVTHEMGQWCVFPDFKEMAQYTGAYRAKNFEMFKQDLADHGMGNMGERFLMASGKLQALCYKFEIEKSLRTKGLGGFQLLGLQDFPGQGTALVGMLNPFWKEKGYISEKDIQQFLNTTVPLVRMPKFVFTNNEQLTGDVELYNYSGAPLKKAVLSWILKDVSGKAFAQGSFPPADYAVGQNLPVGKLDVPLQKANAATKLTLEVQVNGTAFKNSWDCWVYPQSPAVTHDENVLYTDTLDANAEAVLNKGGKVFLMAAGKVVKGKEVVNYFTPVFWNTSWFKMRPPHTTGFVCDPAHAAFADFPTEYHSNIQWWQIVNRAQVMHLEDFPKGFTPVLQPIDTWFMNRKLAMLLEAKVGNGKLFICSADITTNLDKRPAAKQLAYSLKKYVASEKFNPTQTVELQVVRDVFSMPSKETWDAYTKDSPDELKPIKQLKLQ